MLKNLAPRKYVLLALMAITILLPSILFLTSRYGMRVDMNNKLLSILGFSAVMILLWQYLLGIRFITSKIIIDLVWVNRLHQYMGMYGSLIIFAHPFVLFINRGIERYLPHLMNFDNPRSIYILLGEIAILITLSTWFGSAFMRRKVPYRTWKRLHLINYVILPLALIHALSLGSGITGTVSLRVYFVVVAFVYIFAVLARLTAQVFGLGKEEAKLVESKQLSHDVKQLTFQVAADNNLLKANPGQFLYLQVRNFGENHPFTIALVDQAAKRVSIMPKDSGPFSRFIHTLPTDTNVYLDGPYGVFTSELSPTDAAALRIPVFIAGGIGITPFVRHIQRLGESNKRFALFYANKTEQDIVLNPEFAELAKRNPQVIYVPVLSNQPEYAGETGYITAAIIKKYLTVDLSNFNFYVCGPAPMMKAVTKELKSLGIDKSQIFSEKFSL